MAKKFSVVFNDRNAERIERMVTGIVRQLESTGEPEIEAEQIGRELGMSRDVAMLAEGLGDEKTFSAMMRRATSGFSENASMTSRMAFAPR